MDNSEEFQCLFHEQYIKLVKKRPYIWGTYVWLLADCASDGRNQGGDPGKNHKGLVTFDRKIKKDAFYLYKAFWRTPEEEPFVHICGKRYERRHGKRMTVKIYSNTAKVSLYNNGKLIGTQVGEGIFEFTFVPEPKNRLLARGEGCDDGCVLFSVSRPDPAYKLQSKSNGRSWEKTKANKKG